MTDELAFKPLGEPFTSELNTPVVQQKDYNITKSEWVADNRNQIMESGTAGNSTSTIYTVPENRTFFLTHFEHIVTSTGAGGSLAVNSYLYIRTSPAGFRNISRVRLAENLQQSKITSGDLIMPIKLFSGQTIEISAGVNFKNTAVIFGYEEAF